MKVGANVPVFVLEFLLGKYCASADPVAIETGLQVVNDTLAENFVRPDEANKAQSMVMDKGRHTFIDKVKVRVADDDKHWAEAVNFGDKYLHVPPEYSAGLRPAADGRHLGAGRRQAPVRRGGQGQAPVLDRAAQADPARHLRPRRVPGGRAPSSRPTSGSTS